MARVELGEPATTYEFESLDPGIGRFGWLFLLVYVLLIIFGNLPVKIGFGVLLMMHATALFLGGGRRQRRGQGVEVCPNGLRITLGYGPSIVVAYHEIKEVNDYQPRLGPLSRFANVMAQVRTPGWSPFLLFNTQIRFAKRKWTLVLTPLPLIWLSSRMALPISNNGQFIADVRRHLAAGA